MAVENVSFYKYLEAAFRYRLFNPQGVRATLKTRFNYPGFNLTYDRIFYYARRVLPSFYRTSFPDTEEGNLQMARTVLEKLDQHQDLELDRYFTTPPAENAPVIEEAAEESVPQQPPAAAPAAAGPLPGVAMRPPSMPRLPSVTQKTSEPTRKFNLSVFKPPASFANIAKNFGSKLGVFFKKNVGKFFTVGRIATVVSSGIGAVVGAGLTNSSPAGIFGGAGLGAITPSWIRSGGGAKFLGQIGNGAINFGANLSNQVASGATRLSMSSGSKKWALGLLGAFILFFGISLIGGLTGTTSPGQAGPLPPGGGDISNCKFTRSGVSNRIRSSTLISFFTEVAAKTGIPAAVLATLAMHESANFVTSADNNHDAFGGNITTATGCTHFGLTDIGASSTGALGLMQVQPPKRIHDIVASTGKIPSFENVGAYSADGVERGAKFIGKTADSLTLQDFCDVKTSIYLGAGVLISKNGGKPPTTGDDVNKAVCGYYGACQYGPYNYGLEAKQDFENCQPMPGTVPSGPGTIGFSVSCPLGNNFTISCGTATNPVNNCGHGGIGYAPECNPVYYVCNGTRYADALYHAIDVIGTSNTVTLPFINGNESMEWIRIEDQPIPIGGGTWGYRVDYQTVYKGKRLFLNLTHLNSQINSAKTLKSGEQVGTVFAGIGHLHTGLSVDDRWIEPVQEARMCTQ